MSAFFDMSSRNDNNADVFASELRNQCEFDCIV